MSNPLKVDLFREHRDEYVMATAPTLVRTGPGRYLTVVGTGSPDEEEFKRRLGALYGCAYTITFACKKNGRDFRSASSRACGGRKPVAPIGSARRSGTGAGS